MASEVVVVGVSHKTAPVEVRERLSVATEHVGEEVKKLIDRGLLNEGVLVSTCNRIELYAAAKDPVAAAKGVREHLQGATEDDVNRFFYERWGSEAIQHAFRVASSLDSLVVGEPQILGQFKHAYTAAEAAGAVGALMNRCFNRAFAVAKRVRSETGIAAGTVSVSSIAIELAAKIFGNLHNRRALLVGAGKMSEAAAKTLSKKGARLYVVNRSPDRAEQLAAACGGEPRGYELLGSELIKADVVISSTASPRYVITADMLQDVIKARRHRPLFLIDIALPRDIDPRCGNMENVFLYDIDDLQEVANENLSLRKREADKAERIVAEEAERFEQWRRSLSVTPTIVAMRNRVKDIVRSELERTLPRLKNLSPKERKSLDVMADAMVKKLLHQPIVELKRGGDADEAAQLIDAARRLFDLPDEPDAVPEKSGERVKATAEEVVQRLAPAGGRTGEGR